MQYPSSPAGRWGLSADVHGRVSPTEGTGWPTDLYALLVIEQNYHNNIIKQSHLEINVDFNL